MNESELWKTLNRKMKQDWEAERIETIGPGVPDVYYTTTQGTMGWIELKHIHDWPARSTTIVRLKHFTPEQRNWIRKHGKLGANVFLLLQVSRDYLLFNYTEAAKKVGRSIKQDLYNSARATWQNSINKEDLLAILNCWEKTNE